MYRWEFPWNKPSSYWGPIDGNPQSIVQGNWSRWPWWPRTREHFVSWWWTRLGVSCWLSLGRYTNSLQYQQHFGISASERYTSHNSWYMGVDLKVHLGVFITKAASVTAWDPAIFFCWVRDTHDFFGERFGDSLFDECFTILTLIVSMGEAISFWILHGRDTIDPRTMLQSSRAVWLICKICFAKVSRKWRKRRCPWKPMEAHGLRSTFAASREPGNNESLLFPGGIPTWPFICPWLSPWSLTQLPFTCITRRKNNVELRKIRANIFYSRRMAVCRWKNLDILDQPPYPNSSWVKDGYSTGSRTRQGSWAELSPWPQVWPSQN